MGSNSNDAFVSALISNNSWAVNTAAENPTFFPTLSQGQSPAILWLGCSDSRVPETTLLARQPGDVFVHRNIANVISPSDINSAAVIEYAVAHLKVKHIVLCGHTSCGGVAAAMAGGKVGGVLDAWLTPLKMTKALHKAELEAIEDEKERAVRLVELNVQAGVESLLANLVVQDAVKERGLKVHGVVYDISTGKLRDLMVGTE